MNTQLLFELAMIVQVCIGFVCAYKLGPHIHLVKRLLVLSPCFMALLSLFGAFTGQYVAYMDDVTYAIANITVYIILALLIQNNQWCKNNEPNTIS